MDARFLAFLSVSALLIVAPGPDMVLVTRNALRSGRASAVLTGLGVVSGIAVWGGASTLGLATLLARSAAVFGVLRLAGAAYLLYLGLHALVSGLRKRAGTEQEEAEEQVQPRLAQSFRQGLLCNLLNPKAAVIFVTIIPQFVRPGDPPLRFVLMMLCFALMALLWLSGYGALVGSAGRRHVGRRGRQALQLITGCILLGLGGRLAFER